MSTHKCVSTVSNFKSHTEANFFLILQLWIIPFIIKDIVVFFEQTAFIQISQSLHYVWTPLPVTTN